tara:strand:- start:506 stop:883 length:378 start_codon:yes stop_codon:yes gene_type:complete
VYWGTKTFKSSLRGRTSGVRHALHTLTSQYNIKKAGTEKPNRFYNAIACGWSIIAVADTILSDQGIPPATMLTATQLKKFATGKGNAKKEDMIAAVKAKYPQFDGDDNAADAVMIALYALKESRS